MACDSMPRRISIAALGLCLLTAAALHGCTSRLGEGTEPMDCSDYADNDADGLFDCADPGCEAAPACQPPPLSDAFELGPQLECMSPYEGIDRFSEEGLQRGLTVIVEEGGNGGSTVPRRALGGALALSDLDGDGDFDIIQGPKTFYENDGAAHFTELPGLTTEDSPTDTDYMAAVDLDGDGLPELIGARNIPPEIVPQVWHNLGDFQFEQIQQLDVPHSGHELSNQTISLADIDGDNDLDLAYITGGVDPSTGGGYPTTLYRYDFEAGLFEQWFHLYADSDSSPASDVSSQVGLFTDHDRDGDPDLYIANDFGNLGFPSALWRNDGPQEGAQEPAMIEYGAQVYADLKMNAMGIDSIDLNHDGRLDYCLTDVGLPRCLQSRTEDGSYVQVGYNLGLLPDGTTPQSAITTVGWSFDFADLDNDSWVEAVHASAPDSTSLEIGWDEFGDLLWQGSEDGLFTDVSALTGFDSLDANFGMVTGDLDGDGWLEIVVAGPGNPPRLHMNRCGSNSWVEVELVGPPGNSEGYGALVEVDLGDRTELRELHNLRATSQGPSRLHFGLGTLETISSLRVHWPDGELTEGHGIGARRLITVTHSGATP